MLRRRSHRRFFHAALLAVLALGLVIQPTLGALSELHGAEHAALAHAGDDARATHGHHGGHPVSGEGHGTPGHHHGTPGHAAAVPAAGGHPHGSGGDPGRDDHALGSHGLLHLATSVSVTLPEASIGVPTAPFAPQRLPDAFAPGSPRKAPDLPFRPPIA